MKKLLDRIFFVALGFFAILLVTLMLHNNAWAAIQLEIQRYHGVNYDRAWQILLLLVLSFLAGLGYAKIRKERSNW